MPRPNNRFYDLLETSPQVTRAGMKTAYKRIAQRLKSDRYRNDAEAAERMEEVDLAYSVLSDPEKRKLYDEFGEAILEPGFDAALARGTPPLPPPKPTEKPAEAPAPAPAPPEPGPQDRYQQPPPQGAARGMDGPTEAPEPWAGFSRGPMRPHFDNQPPPKARRAAAAGYRAPPAPEPHQREDDGKGTELVPHASSRGRVRGPPPPRPRPERDESGVRPTEAWVSFRRACLGGKGEVMIEGEVRDINIPPGAMDGTIIMLDDTSITLRVEPHEVLERDGFDLHMELEVDEADAERGARMLVPTLETEVTVIVPPDVQTGQKLRVGGRGIPTGKGDERGDLIVTVYVRESDFPPAGRIRLKRSDPSSGRPRRGEPPKTGSDF